LTFEVPAPYQLYPVEILHLLSGGKLETLSYLVSKRCFVPDWALVSFMSSLPDTKRACLSFLRDVLGVQFYVKGPKVKSSLSLAVFGFWNELLHYVLTRDDGSNSVVRIPMKRYLQGTKKSVERQLHDLSLYLIGSFLLEDVKNESKSCYSTLFQKVWIQSDPDPQIFLVTHGAINDILTGKLFGKQFQLQNVDLPECPNQVRYQWSEVYNEEFLTKQGFISLNPDVIGDLKKERSRKNLFHYLLLERKRYFCQKQKENFNDYLVDEVFPNSLNSSLSDLKGLGKKLLDHGVLAYQTQHANSVNCYELPEGILGAEWFFSKFSYHAYVFEKNMLKYIHEISQKQCEASDVSRKTIIPIEFKLTKAKAHGEDVEIALPPVASKCTPTKLCDLELVKSLQLHQIEDIEIRNLIQTIANFNGSSKSNQKPLQVSLSKNLIKDQKLKRSSNRKNLRIN
jgi:hypothetical protein